MEGWIIEVLLIHENSRSQKLLLSLSNCSSLYRQTHTHTHTLASIYFKQIDGNHTFVMALIATRKLKRTMS